MDIGYVLQGDAIWSLGTFLTNNRSPDMQVSTGIGRSESSRTFWAAGFSSLFARRGSDITMEVSLAGHIGLKSGMTETYAKNVKKW